MTGGRGGGRVAAVASPGAWEEGEKAMRLSVRVVEIKGRCPVYQVGDSFTLENGYKLISETPVCMHSLGALMPFYNALRVSEPAQWGLAGKGDKSKAYVQCPDAVSHTGGGTAIFEIRKVEEP